ncbi:helix-turn-helix domain-containing protein [Effusibacillus dendaii]|uniref:XRE family transcriptional regulator n=1 Tax=Effusibacillus dendaii TaxID=2743772 RepID=A0A7I8D6H7_9BACL|nr:helix-turn-helix domain-containing protein [Effusibacillus dendaii]BCJ85753.1 XRE family transcriptional regulator [Effusibacillus dendaii]
MEELGRILRTARENGNLTLDEIQDRTKISKRYLMAIEAGDLSVLPGLVYARGFIKNYAEQVGVDGDALLDKYGLTDKSAVSERRESPALETVKQPEVKEMTPIRSERRADGPKNPKPVASPPVQKENRMGPQFLIGFLVIALIGVGYWLLNNYMARQDAAPAPAAPMEQPTNQTPAPAPAPQPAVPPVKPQPTGPLKPETKDDNRSVYKVDGDGIKLEIQIVNNPCWLNIQVDGESKLTRTVVPGTSISFDGKKEIFIKAGFPPAMQVKVNGQPVEVEQVEDPYGLLFQKK